MQMRIKHLFQSNFFIFPICVTFVIGYLSLMKMPKQSISAFSNSDKLYHLIAYFGLSTSWLLNFKNNSSLKFVIIFSCIAYGILIEVLQTLFTTYRTGDIKDILANTIGVLLGLFVFNIILKKISFN